MSFGLRLREAFRGASNAEIARKLRVTDAAAKNYLGGRVPDAQKLGKISDLTSCSIHWLLTGKGPKYVGADDATSNAPVETAAPVLDEVQVVFIERLAAFEDVSYEEMLKRVVYGGLDARLRDLSSAYRKMNKQQMEDVLDAYLSNVEPPDAAQQEGARKNNGK